MAATTKRKRGILLMDFQEWEPSEKLKDVVGRAFDDILYNRDGLLTVNPAPTGAGKSHLLPHRILDYILQKLSQPSFNAEPDVIIVAAPNRAQVSHIFKDFENLLSNLAEGERDQVDAFFIPNQQQLLSKTGNGKNTAEESIQRFNTKACPAFQNKVTQKRMGLRYSQVNNALKVNENVDERIKDFMRSLSAPCKSEIDKKVKQFGRLGSTCSRCILMNAGGRMWGKEGPRFRVAFMTYARLIHGFKSSKYENHSDFGPTVLRSRYMPGGDGNYFKPIKNTAIFLEEAAQGYERLWDNLVVDSSSVDLISFGQELVRQIRTQSHNIIRELQAIIRSEQIQCSQDDKEEYSLGLERLLEKRINRANEFFNTFYLRTPENAQQKAFENGHQVELRLVRHPNSEGETVRLVQPVDISLSFLSDQYRKPQLAYIAEYEKGESITDQYRVVVGLKKHFTEYDNQENADIRAGDLRLMVHFFYEFVVRPGLGFMLRINQDLKSWANKHNRELLEPLILTKLDQLGERVEQRLDDTDEVFSLLLEQEMKRLPKQAGGTRDRDSFDLTVQDSFYLSGYTMVETEDHYGEGLCHTRINFAKSTPEGFLYSLLKAQNSVCLVTASASVGSVLRMFDTRFLDKDRDIKVKHWSNEEAEQAENELRGRYNNFQELKTIEFPNSLDESGKNFTTHGAWLSDYAKSVLRNKWEILSQSNSQAARDIIDSAVAFAKSVKENPLRPRYLVAVTNKGDDAEILKDILYLLLSEIKSNERINVRHVFSSKQLESGQPLREQIDFSKMLLDEEKEAPVLVITASRQSLSVGANLQLKISKNELAEKNKNNQIVSSKLKEFIGKEEPILRHYPNAKDCQLDVSDLMVSATTSYLIDGDKHKYRQLISLLVSNSVEPDLLTRGAGKGHKELHTMLGKTDVLPIEQLEFLNQFIGRASRTANPPLQTLWLPEKVVSRISQLDIGEIYNRTKPVSHQFTCFLEWMRNGDENLAQPFEIVATDIAARMKGLAYLLFGSSSEIRKTAREAWTLLKLVIPYFELLNNNVFEINKADFSHIANKVVRQRLETQNAKNVNVNESDFSSYIISLADQKLQQLNQLMGDGNDHGIPRSLRDFYMEIPINYFSSPFISKEPTRLPRFHDAVVESSRVVSQLDNEKGIAKISREKMWGKVTAYTLNQSDKIFIGKNSTTLSKKSQQLDCMSFKTSWRTHHPQTLSRLKAKQGSENNFVVLRPDVKKYMSIPFFDEWITREQTRLVDMAGVPEDQDLFEKADHFIPQWGILIDNKSSVLWDLDRDEAMSDLNEKIQKAREKLSSSNGYDTFIYVLRHHYSLGQKPITSIKRGTLELGSERGDCDVYFVQLQSNENHTPTSVMTESIDDGLLRVLKQIRNRKINAQMNEESN